MKITILDGYVDEPTCFGVPPFISTYVRYVAGALVLSGVPEESIDYTTIDAYRQNKEILENSDVLIVISGITVPGRYLGGKPLTENEIEKIGLLGIPYKVIGGPICFGYSLAGGKRAKNLSFKGFNLVVEGDIEKAAYEIGNSLINNERLPEGRIKFRRTAQDVDRFAPLGAFIVKKHPNFPNVICEIETFRGCERNHHCSYCTEAFYGRPDERNIDGILSEMEELSKNGIEHFRIGRQPNILGYKALPSNGEFPIPNYTVICNLFKRIHDEISPKTLHIDNVNAGTIAVHPIESEKALRCISRFDTEGDICPFGLESADGEVIRMNNLKVDAKGIMKAVRLVNKIGRFKKSENALYKLLPGLNFLIGLPGETRETFKKNEDLLRSMLNEDLLLRRINIRQVMVFEGTPISKMVKKAKTKYRREFKAFKSFVRENIDLPMVKKVFPTGTVIKNILLEAYDGEHTLGRQLATYPILVRIPERLKLLKMIDVVIVGHRERSVMGIPYPIDINKLSLKLLSFMPQISRKRAADIVLKRPFKSKDELLRNFPELKQFIKYIIFTY